MKILYIFSIVFLFGFIFIHGAHASLFSIITDLFSYLLELIASFFVQAANVFVTIFNSVIQGTGYFVSGSVVDVVWTFIRDLINMTFIIAMLITAVYKMIGKENALAQKKFTTQIIYILIGAFIINFSKVIFGAIIDVTNLIAMIFVNSYKDSVGTVFSNLFNITRVGTSTAAVTREFTESLLLCIFAIALFAYSVTLLFYGVIRLAILTISTMLSPLFIFSFFFPLKISFIENLNIKKQFFDFAFGGITVTFFLWISLMILSAGGSGQLSNAVFGSDESQAIQGKINPVSSQNSQTDPDFWSSFMMKIVAVGILFLAQKTAMTMAKEAGFGMNKVVEKAADTVNKVGMAPINFAKGQAKNTADYAKFLGSKAKDSAIGGALNWANNGDNFASKSVSKAMSVADSLREKKEDRTKYMSDRANVMKNTSTLEGAQKKRKYEQNQANITGEAIRSEVASIKPEVDRQIEKQKEIAKFKNNRKAFISGEVMKELENGVDKKEYSTDNVNDNFITALLTAQTIDENGAMADVITSEQKNEINNAEGIGQKSIIAKNIFDNLSPEQKAAVEDRLNKKYSKEVSDRKERVDEIKQAYDSGNVELGQQLAMDTYNSDTLVNKSKIDSAYNKRLGEIRGSNEDDTSKEERAINRLERKKKFVQEQIKLGKGSYTDKDIDTIDAQITEEKKKILAKQAEQNLRGESGALETLKKKRNMSKEEIEALIDRDKKYREMGGDEKLEELEREEKIAIIDNDNLNNTNNEADINKLLSENSSSPAFQEKLRGMINEGKISSNLASWIKSKKQNNENITIDELRNNKKNELSVNRSSVDEMRNLKLNDEERTIVDTSYSKLKDARKNLADAKKDVKKQQEKVEEARAKAAGVYEEPKSDKWNKIKDIQTKLKETYVDSSGRFDKDTLDLTSFLIEDDLKNGKFKLQNGAEEDFAAAMALKLSSKGKLTSLEEQTLADRGIVDSVMKYINSGNDNTARKEWNKQIEKSGNTNFISKFRAKIIESKPKVVSFSDREKDQNTKYSEENIQSRVVEYLASQNLSKFKDNKGNINVDKLESDLKGHFGRLDFSSEDLLGKLLQEAQSKHNDIDKVKNYDGKSNNLDIIKSIDSLKDMYLRSRAGEYREQAKAKGLKNENDINKYAERMAYKDVMNTFNPSAIKNGNLGLGKIINGQMAQYGYKKDDEEAFTDMFIKAVQAQTQSEFNNVNTGSSQDKNSNSEYLDQISDLTKSAINSSGNDTSKLSNQLLALKDAILQNGDVSDLELEKIVSSSIIPELLNSGKVNDNNIDSFISKLSQDHSIYSDSIIKELLSSDILSQFNSGKTKDTTSLIDAMLKSDRLNTVLSSSKVNESDKQNILRSVFESASQKSGLDFTSNRDQLTNYVSQKLSSTQDTNQKDLLNTIVRVLKDNSEYLDQISDLTKSAINSSGNDTSKLSNQLLALKDAILQNGDVSDLELEKIVSSSIIPELLNSGKVNDNNIDSFISKLSQDHSIYSDSIIKELLSSDILSQFNSGKTKDTTSLIDAMLKSDRLNTVLSSSKVNESDKQNILRSVFESASQKSGLDFTSNRDQLTNYVSQKLSSTQDTNQKDLLNVISNIINNNSQNSTSYIDSSIINTLKENTKNLLESSSGSNYDNVSRKLDELISGVNNLNSESDSKNVLKSVDNLEQTVGDLKSMLGELRISGMNSLQELERELDDLKFVFEQISTNGDVKSEEDKKNEFELTKQTISQLRRLLDGLLGNNTEDKTIKESINTFAGQVSLDKDFQSKLYNIARSVDNSATPGNEANKTILLETIKSIASIPILEEILSRIDKSQQDIINIIKGRIENLGKFNNF